MEYYKAHARIFKALMHPGRLAILEALRSGEQCVCHLEAVLGCRQAYISQHLAVLREVGIVEDHRDGWNIYYRIAHPEVFSLIEQSSVLLPEQERSLKPISIPTQACPCPKCSEKQLHCQVEASHA